MGRIINCTVHINFGKHIGFDEGIIAALAVRPVHRELHDCAQCIDFEFIVIKRVAIRIDEYFNVIIAINDAVSRGQRRPKLRLFHLQTHVEIRVIPHHFGARAKARWRHSRHVGASYVYKVVCPRRTIPCRILYAAIQTLVEPVSHAATHIHRWRACFSHLGTSLDSHNQRGTSATRRLAYLHIQHAAQHTPALLMQVRQPVGRSVRPSDRQSVCQAVFRMSVSLHSTFITRADGPARHREMDTMAAGQMGFVLASSSARADASGRRWTCELRSGRPAMHARAPGAWAGTGQLTRSQVRRASRSSWRNVQMGGSSSADPDDEVQRRNRLAIEQEFNLGSKTSTATSPEASQSSSSGKAASAAATMDSEDAEREQQESNKKQSPNTSKAEPPSDSLDEGTRKALRERIELQATTQRQWAEICAMFVTLEGMSGIELMDRKSGNPSFKAWVFVLLWWTVPIGLVYYLYKFSSGIHF
ncbi:hypothetical protein FVE85_3134 [Porphyridium purpureum]|uniref:Uncharacterized protein n=1 Tax=Porphyridium purpureum TaxID=35688 RepID=A0A5J4YVY2_PORPP|nr:hypothetical protein FVE85_3134 [Porphyridium purpureum]|eukprot:POR4756..scf227_4